MAMAPRTRWILLGTALAATLAAAVWVGDGATPEVVVVAPSKPAPHNAFAPATRAAKSNSGGATPSLALEKLNRRAAPTDKPANAFPAQSWYVPPPPPKPVPPPPPAPPPLPFSYLGKLQEEGKLTVFLAMQDKNFAIKTGDTLEGSYRVDSVDAQRVVFTYLPLNMQQTLIIGGVN